MNIKINGVDIAFFNNFTLNLKYDSVASTFSFNAIYDPGNKSTAFLFKPLSYNEIEIFHQGELFLTGTILNHTFSSKPQKTAASFSGKSLPGILEDCEIPIEAYPLQSDNKSLKEIAQKLVNAFNIRMVIDPSVSSLMDEVFEKSVAKETQSPKDYLASLCSQKNIILSHTAKGELLFTRAKITKPIINFQDKQDNTEMGLSINGQGIFSQTTILRQSSVDGGNAGQGKINNPLISRYRPKIQSQSSGTDNDTAKVARNALSAQMKNIKLKVNIDRWIIENAILKPNKIITAISQELFLDKKTEFFIESIDYIGDHQKNTMALACVLPQVYNQDSFKNIFS